MESDSDKPASRRDVLAAAALAGLLANHGTSAAQVVLDAIAYADTMIAALDAPPATTADDEEA